MTQDLDQNQLLTALRTRGKVVSIPRMGETIYELDGRRYRYFLVKSQDLERQPQGPWRAEELGSEPDRESESM